MPPSVICPIWSLLTFSCRRFPGLSALCWRTIDAAAADILLAQLFTAAAFMVVDGALVVAAALVAGAFALAFACA